MSYLYFEKCIFRCTGLNSDEMLVRDQLKHLFMIFEPNCGCFHGLDVEFADVLFSVRKISPARSIYNKIF